MTEIIDRYKSLQIWQKALIIALVPVIILTIFKPLLDILVALMLIAVPFSFFLVVASEDLQDRIKSSKFLSQLPGVSKEQSGIYVALAFSGTLLVIAIALFLLRVSLFSLPTTAPDDQQATTGTTAPASVATSTQSSLQSSLQSGTQTADATATSQKSQQSPIRFQVAYADTDIRSDEGYYCYVLTDPVDISKDDIKLRVETIVRDIVKATGEKVTIDIFDNEKALITQYKFWVAKEIDEPLSPKLEALIERHQIASFEGGSTVGPSANTMILFPNSTNKTTEVSALAASYEFNP